MYRRAGGALATLRAAAHGTGYLRDCLALVALWLLAIMFCLCADAFQRRYGGMVDGPLA
ncbi:MAG: hypothetical protein GPOALKHO_001606 [Sodalis sp.]|nr:MAG: hypothetical protein GPOALKHO_001606 [Sodalis sp.]